MVSKEGIMARKIARCADIPEGGNIVVSLEDGREVAIFHIGEEYYALDNRCPHMEGPLGEGELDGCVVTCPWHGWQFDVRNGECQNMPGEQAKKIPLTVEDGFIWI